LLKLQSAPAVVTLLGALRRDSWQVRRNAAAVLGQIQATWAVEPLAKALDDAHPVVRRTAAAALRRIGSADAINALRARFTEQARSKAVSKPAPPKSKPETRTDVPAPPASLPEVAPVSSIAEPPISKEDTVPASVARTHHTPAPSSDAAVPVEVVQAGTIEETRPARGRKQVFEAQRDAARAGADDKLRPSRFRQSVDKLISFFSRDQAGPDGA
ncbi:MAG: HEAT repeat domain-containing protein, partial [Anaerolineae bacterium]|nr:HEAT repeat domain-containing protein [Anaerolineae bacterium]